MKPETAIGRWGRKSAPASDAGSPALLVKASTADIEIKADAGEEGTLTGYGSVFEKVDSYGESVMPGAFRKSLKGWKQRKRPIPMLWQHRSDQPVGVWTLADEDEKGLYLEGKLNLETQRGREAWSDVKAQAVTGLSIGYFEVKADPWDMNEEIRKLYELDLRETSIVTFPALREAQIDTVKARLVRGERLTIREFETLLRERGGFSREQAEEIALLGYKAFLQRDVAGAGGQREVGSRANDVGALRELRQQIGGLKLPTL